MSALETSGIPDRIRNQLGPRPRRRAPGSLLRRAGVASTPHGFRSSARS